MEGRVQAARARVEHQRQGVDVGALELRVQPPVEEHGDHRVGGPQLLEDRGIGRVAGLGALAARQVELVEEDLLELLGAAERELVADRVVDVRLEPRDLVPEVAASASRAARSMATPVASMSASTGMSGSSSSSGAVEVGLVQGGLQRPERRRRPRPRARHGPAAQCSRARGSSTSSRSAVMSPSDWLRSAALRM